MSSKLELPIKQVLTRIVLLLSAKVLSGQPSLVPAQYRLIKEVFGDLDKDGMEERASVYNISDREDEENGTAREVMIYKREKGNWNIWHRSLTAVGNSKDGGMMGDPFMNIEIKNGVLIIRQAGGSSWKWSNTDKYRYQNGAFELIGHTSFYGKPCEYRATVDFYLSTGKVIFNKEYERCGNRGSQVVYRRDGETFVYKVPHKITFEKRNADALKIRTPKYKEALYL